MPRVPTARNFPVYRVEGQRRRAEFLQQPHHVSEVFRCVGCRAASHRTTPTTQFASNAIAIDTA